MHSRPLECFSVLMYMTHRVPVRIMVGAQVMEMVGAAVARIGREVRDA